MNNRSYLPRTWAFIRHSWPIDMMAEINAVEAELNAAERQRTDLLGEVIKLRHDVKRAVSKGNSK